MTWGSDIEIERRRRILLSVAAYSYEFEDDSIITDGEFDRLALSIDPSISTGHKKLDKFFKNKFDPSTGQWIHDHPERSQVRALYLRMYKGRKHQVSETLFK